MATQSKNQSTQPQAGDPLFNLKHAEAEAELAKKNGGLGPTTNVYTTEAEEANIDEGPRDSQGSRRGEQDPSREGSNAGSHQ